MTGVGYSNGANMAVTLHLLHPNVLAGSVVFRPMVPLVPKSLPNLPGVRVFISSGLHDTSVPKKEAVRPAELLRKAGATVPVGWENAAIRLARAILNLLRSCYHNTFRNRLGHLLSKDH